MKVRRHQGCGDDGQYTDDVVHFVRHDVLVDVGEGIGDFVAGIDEFFGLDDVFDKIFQIGFQFNGFFDLTSLSQSGAQFLVWGIIRVSGKECPVLSCATPQFLFARVAVRIEGVFQIGECIVFGV